MALSLIISACLVSAASGIPGLLLPRRSALGQWIAVLGMSAASVLGMARGFAGLMAGSFAGVALPGPLPDWGFRLQLDPLSAFFLVPIFLMGGASSVFGLRYWEQARHSRNGRKLSLCLGLVVAGLAGVTLAGDGVTFLFAWEVMALSAFFLVSTEDQKREARRAGWLYLVATHIGTLTLFAFFACWRYASGSFMLRPLEAGRVGLGLQLTLFLLAFVAFGLKAGMMPLHFWLPSAHANAPSHVSALLSGVLLKIGIYGMVRTVTLLPQLPLVCGLVVLIMGAISALLGVAFALGQHDLKRLLAYHSIENIGIILLGLGLALAGSALHRPEWAALGMAGCLLHVWNHCLFKSILFLSAGSVLHSAGTREIDLLGGLAQRMPGTAAFFAVGAVAICGLPPLNGFVSELIIYLGLFRAAGSASAGSAGIGLAAPVLAMVGALAVACFIKAYGTVFLGTARGSAAVGAHESPLSMLAPMALLAALCLAIGLAPLLVMPLLQRVLATWPAGSGISLDALVPGRAIGLVGIGLLAGILGSVMLIRTIRGHRRSAAAPTWDCGCIACGPRVQYTASSFAAMLVGLFHWVLHPREHRTPPAGIFPAHASFESHVPDAVLDGALAPAWSRIRLWLSSARVLQQGRVQHYLLYILLALFGLLLSLVPILNLARRLLGR